MPLAECLMLIALSVLLNLWLVFRLGEGYRPTTPVATLQLAWDLCQLSGLLALTGGLQNPFSLLLLAPVSVSATTLPQRSTFILAALAVVLASLLSVFHLDLPWEPDQQPGVRPGLCDRHLGLDHLRHRVHRRLYQPGGARGAAAVRRAGGHRTGAVAARAAERARRPRRRRRARTGHAALDHPPRRAGNPRRGAGRAGARRHRADHRAGAALPRNPGEAAQPARHARRPVCGGAGARAAGRADHPARGRRQVDLDPHRQGGRSRAGDQAQCRRCSTASAT